MSKAILITSYYRSGTSALSGTLNLAGVVITNTDEQNEHNPRGYFENPVLAKNDLELFDRLDRKWHDIRLMPAHWWQRPDVGKDTQFIVNDLHSRFLDTPLWGVKHPHLCRLLPIYEDAVKRVSGELPHIIHIYRDPWVVAHSQYKKNGLALSHSLLLWASYVLDGEHYARHLNRVVLDYETLVKDTPAALRRIGDTLGIDFPKRSPKDLAEINRFLTPSLRRSKPRGRDDTPAGLRGLIGEIWDAAVGEADSETFTGLRTRFNEYCHLIEDLAQTSLSVTSNFKPQGVRSDNSRPAQPGESDDIEGSPLRPAELTDKAEKARLVSAVAKLDPAPSLEILVAVPEGRVESAYVTAKSIERQWYSPANVSYICSDPKGPTDDGWVRAGTEPGELTQLLSEHANQSQADYVCIIDAGNTIEPDAIARLAVFAVGNNRPAAIYSDEIVGTQKNPWVRYKPEFDIERIRGLHYLGGLLCLHTRWLEESPLAGDIPGAEDLDIALRLWERGAPIARLPEAIFVWTPDSRRDVMNAEILHTNALKALESHLQRCQFESSIDILATEMPGLFNIRHRALPGRHVSLVLLCNEASVSNASDLQPQRLEQVTNSLGLENVIVAASDDLTEPALGEQIDELEANNPLPERLHVVKAETEGVMLRRITDHAGDDAVIMLSLDADTDDAAWLGHLQGKLLGQIHPIGAIGASAQFTADDENEHLIGPLLLGGNEGVSVIGLAREADDAGPGAWLKTPQNVDAVAPPCLAFHGKVLKDVDIDTTLSGAALWLDIGLKIRQKGFEVIWDPTVRVNYPHPPAYAVQSDMQSVESSRTIRKRWGCTSDNHHPRLALHGDNLSALANEGMCAPTPRPAIHALLSGNVDGAEYAIEWLRELRMDRLLSASWAQEPLSITETLRLSPDAWLRVNPDSPVNAPDAPQWQALFTRPTEADAQTLKEIGENAQRVLATSPTLAQALQKRSYNRVRPTVVSPRLPGRVWKDFKNTVGRHKVRIIWVDEGERPDWITELLSIKGIDWFVVENGQTYYDGPIATFKRPADENGWFDLFSRISPNVVIRPANKATWMDCLPLLRAAAAGAAIYTDPRLDRPEGLPVTEVNAKFDDWRRAIEKIKSEPEEIAAQGRRAREALERIGWIEDQAIIDMLMATDNLAPIASTG